MTLTINSIRGSIRKRINNLPKLVNYQTFSEIIVDFNSLITQLASLPDKKLKLNSQRSLEVIFNYCLVAGSAIAKAGAKDDKGYVLPLSQKTKELALALLDQESESTEKALAYISEPTTFKTKIDEHEIVIKNPIKKQLN